MDAKIVTPQLNGRGRRRSSPTSFSGRARILGALHRRLPHPTRSVLRRLPVALVPFTILTFVHVQGLAEDGQVNLFAGCCRSVDCHLYLVQRTMPRLRSVLASDCHVGYAAQTLEQWYSPLEFSSLDRSDSLHPKKKKDAVTYSLSNDGAFIFAICFAAWATTEEYLEGKGISVHQWRPVEQTDQVSLF